jgi:hypothetical protein
MKLLSFSYLHLIIYKDYFYTLIIYRLFLIKNQGRLRSNLYFFARDEAQTFLVDNTIAASHGVIALRNQHLLCLLVEIIDDYDMLPGINALQTLKLETYEASLLVTIGILTRQELQMLTHLIASRKAEGWMVLAELNQILIEVECLWILLQIGPGKLVDAIRRVVTVVNSLLITKHLLAGKDERYTLRSEHTGLGKLVDAEQLGSTHLLRDILYIIKV